MSGPFHPRQQLAALKERVRAGDLVQARQMAAILRDEHPQAADAWLWSAWLCEDMEEAVSHAERAVALSSNETTEQALRWAQQRLQQSRAQESHGDPEGEGLDPARQEARAPLFPVPQSDRKARGVPLFAALALAAVIAFVAWQPGSGMNGSTPPAPAAISTPTVATASTASSTVPTVQQIRLADEETVSTSGTDDLPTAVAVATEPARATATSPAQAPLQLMRSQVIEITTSARDLNEQAQAKAASTVEVAEAPEAAPAMATTLPARPEDLAYALWPSRTHPATYQVQQSDTPTSIAERFGLQLSTLIWSNPSLEQNPELLTLDQELLIPALDGVLHAVREGETVQSIAATYQADAALIAWFPGNGLPGVDAPLTTGQFIMVPGGQKPYTAPPPPPAAPVAPTAVAAAPAAAAPAPRSGRTAYFGWPAAGYITQTAHAYHVAVDIAGPMNSPIFAAQTGEVVISGWDTTGYGYTMLINHHNGWYTRYAHLSSMYYEVGEWVEKGQVIALMGSTGRSTGPHVHFEVIARGYRYDPLDYLPR